MKIKEKSIVGALTIMSLVLCLSMTLKGNEEALAKCKIAKQTCMIVISQGEETSYPGKFVVE